MNKRVAIVGVLGGFCLALSARGSGSTNKDILLRYYGLDRLVDGGWALLTHGTTDSFSSFDLAHARLQLVDEFYGSGFFFVPHKEKHIAWQYATANRNYGLPASVVDELAKIKPQAADFLRLLMSKGYREAWEILLASGFGSMDTLNGINPDELGDISKFIIGSKTTEGKEATLHDLFSFGTMETPEWVYQNLDQWGLDANQYRPKVYTVLVKGLQNVLVTTHLLKAKTAREDGYDGVIYYGPQAVKGVPEVAIWDPSKIKIIKVEYD